MNFTTIGTIGHTGDIFGIGAQAHSILSIYLNYIRFHQISLFTNQPFNFCKLKS